MNLSTVLYNFYYGKFRTFECPTDTIDDYNNINWAIENPPSKEEIQIKIQELEAAEPLRLLRIERDRLLQECDWRDLPSYPGTDQEEWRTYRQALRDLPNNSEPQLNDSGELINIVWPEKPNGGL